MVEEVYIIAVAFWSINERSVIRVLFWETWVLKFLKIHWFPNLKEYNYSQDDGFYRKCLYINFG